jgi:hypothetical protein
MPVFHKLKIQILMDVTHTRPLDAETRGSTFPQTVSIYCPPHHTIPQQAVHSPKLSLFTTHHTIPSHNRQYIPPNYHYLLPTTPYHPTTGSTFPQTVTIYYTPHHTIPQQAVLYPKLSLFTTHHNIPSQNTQISIHSPVRTPKLTLSFKPLQSTLSDLQKL